MYKTEPQSYADILRKINYQGTDQGMLWCPPGLTTYEYRPGGLGGKYVQRDGILLQNWEVHLAAATGTDVGIGFRYGPSHWKVGRYDGTTYTDLTDLAQARSAITLGVAGADQTGFVLLCDRKVGWISTTITTAETNAGGATVVDHAVTYSNAAGTGWTAIGTVNTDDFTTTNAVWDAALKNFVWQPPADWGKTTAITGLPAGWYAIYFSAAHREAGDVAAIATGIECGILSIAENVTQYTIYAAEKAEWAEFAADGIVAYFSAANALNKVSFACRPIG
jgi:hypothetical protein